MGMTSAFMDWARPGNCYCQSMRLLELEAEKKKPRINGVINDFNLKTRHNHTKASIMLMIMSSINPKNRIFRFKLINDPVHL